MSIYKKLLLPLVILVFFTESSAQLQIIDSGQNCSLRGLSVVSDKVFWVSGSNGTVGRCTNGKNINWQTVAGFENRDFRDIEAFDSNTAVIMAISNPALILKTNDGGKSWSKVFEKSADSMFLDCMSFDTKGNGYCAGDPVNGELYLLETHNFGEHWREWPGRLPVPKTGEAMFASSGSNLQLFQDSHWLFGLVTGGLACRMLLVPRDAAAPAVQTRLPLMQGKQSTGGNSWAIRNNTWLVVGGDFAVPAADSASLAISTDAGKTWTGSKLPGGYKSSVTWLENGVLYACGTTGITRSEDNGKSWIPVSSLAFHVSAASKNADKIYFAGPRGRVGVLSFR